MESVQNLLDFKEKPEDYYSLSRPEMLEYIPKNSKIILDVGCGYGYFGRLVKDKMNSTVWGIELDDVAGESAKSNLDNVFIGDVFDIIETLPKQHFDCIVFNDILEHLVDPYTLLEKTKSLLTNQGVVVCSIPNVRYIGNLKRLLISKQWKYEDFGILDKTHLRFFTKKSIIETMEILGFDIITIKGINQVKTFKFNLLNALFLGTLSDTRYLQFACVVKPKKD
jgi:2-polyprenyl-3-methyl-5-hydroxy-6-metoxy-1,4-benzoquinol methylase